MFKKNTQENMQNSIEAATKEQIKEVLNNIVEAYMNNPNQTLSAIIKEYLPSMPMPIKEEFENLFKNMDNKEGKLIEVYQDSHKG